MDDLTAFIKARLDEDERLALAAGSCDYWVDVDESVPLADERNHALRHHPARVLREVAAKRAITALHYPEWTDYVDGDGIERASRECAECEPPGTPDNWPCPTMRALAAVWSDHPDYRPEWAPLTPAAP